MNEKTTTIRVTKRTRDKIKWISACLSQTQTNLLQDLISSIFEIFSSYNPTNRDASLFMDVYGTKCILNSKARKNYNFSGCISGINPNLSENEENNLVKEQLDGTLGE